MNWSGDFLKMEESGFGVFNITSFDSEDNLTLSCAAKNIQEPLNLPYPTALVMVVRVLQSVLIFLVFSVGSILNVLVIVLVGRYKKLQTVSFTIALQIVVLDLLLAIFYGLSLITSVANRWVFGEHVCSLVGGVVLVTVLTRTGVLFTFVIDRFLLVYFPFSYTKHQIKTVIILSVMNWFFAVVAAIVAYALDCYTFAPNSLLCVVNAACNSNCSILHIVIHVGFVAPCSIIPIFLYALLFVKAKKAKAAIASVAAGVATSAPPVDWKATITFLLMFLTVFVLTLPNLVILFVLRVLYAEQDAPLGLYLLATVAIRLLSLLPITDAVLILRNRDVREVLREIRQRAGCCSPQADGSDATGTS